MFLLFSFFTVLMNSLNIDNRSKNLVFKNLNTFYENISLSLLKSGTSKTPTTIVYSKTTKPEKCFSLKKTIKMQK